MAALTIFLEITVVFALLATVFYKYFTKNFKYWQQKGVPSVTPKVFFGNFQDVVLLKTSIGHFLADLYNKMNEDYFGIWVFGTPHLIIRSPELVKNILVKDFNHFNDRTVASDETADPMTSKALFLVQNPEWKTIRTKVSPIFTSGKIKNMLYLMNECADDLKLYLTKNQGKNIEFKEVCAKFTTDVITSCAFGVHAQSFQHERAAFRDIGRKMFDYNLQNAIRGISYFFAPAIVKLFKLTFFDPSVNEFCRDAFWQTIKAREKSGIKRNDLIDIIIEIKKSNLDGVNFEGDVVVAQALQFFAAGFETTSSTIGFALYELCLHPTKQIKLRREINKVVDECGGVTYEALKQMPYLDMVIKETLRKYPILPFLDRRCVKDYQIPNTNYVIEKGTPVYIPMLGLHYDPKYFPEPEKFIPERFSPENNSKRPQYAYIPFGEGPHNCIGERFGLTVSKLGIIQILLNFCAEQTEDTPVPIVYDPRSFILQSNCGLPMRFTAYNRRMSAAA